MDSFSKIRIKHCIVGLISTIIICIITIIIITKTYYNSKIDNNIGISDIELQKYDDSLKIKIDNLDSIKNAKVIEVKALDNDSTVKLFYKLIK